MSALPLPKRWMIGLALSLLAAGCATGWPPAEEPSLDRWIADELEPYLATKLTTHPRFRGETVAVATMQGEDPQPAPDSVSRALEQRLTRFLLATPGVNLVWEGGRSAGDCTRREDAHYVLAIDLQQTGRASHRLAIRALDREEGLWVSGFSREWNGRLTRTQYARYKQPAMTADSRGLRADPYRGNETDLLAERLAGKLGKQFCGFVGEPLVVYAETGGEPPYVAETVRLVASNLARSPHIRAASTASGANLILSGRLYRIDDELQQFWVQARPAGEAAPFPVTDVQAYVEAGATPAAARPHPAHAHEPRDRAVVLGALRALTPNDPWMCRRTDPWRRGARVLADGESLPDDACFALEMEVTGDAEVFLLRRDPAAGLVRMLPARCGRHGRAAGRSYGEATLRFPASPAGWEHALRPPAAALREHWIALALAADRAAPALRRHLAVLPDECAAADGASVDAQAWLARLDDLVDPAVAVTHLAIPVGRQSAMRD